MKDEKLHNSVAERITQLIVDGVYPPGSRLPGERSLAERFNVGRGTIREAAVALQTQGYISIKTGSGAYVLDPTERESQRLPNVSASDLTKARMLFESEAAALAARNISDETLKHLDRQIKTMASNDPSDNEASQQADREFHLTIAKASGNSAVQHIIEILWQMRNELPNVRAVHASICSRESAAARAADHTEILVALRKHDPLGARLAMQKHFTRLLKSKWMAQPRMLKPQKNGV